MVEETGNNSFDDKSIRNTNMFDVLVLEDDGRLFADLTYSFPEGVSYKHIENTDEFRKYLSDGNRARLYILDDTVPVSADQNPVPQFVDNHILLCSQDPDAEVLYTGSTPAALQKEYCSRMGIPMIQKIEIPIIIREKYTKQ